MESEELFVSETAETGGAPEAASEAVSLSDAVDADDGSAAETHDAESVPDTESEPEPESETQPSQPVCEPADIDRLVAEAEERGYLRGRNERIEELMRRPGVYEPCAAAARPEESTRSEVMILNNLRRSVWE